MKEAVHRKCQKKSGFYKSKEKNPTNRREKLLGLVKSGQKRWGKSILCTFHSLACLSTAV